MCGMENLKQYKRKLNINVFFEIVSFHKGLAWNVNRHRRAIKKNITFQRDSSAKICVP